MSTKMPIDDAALRQAKVELAACLRWAARQGFQSGVCNHFSVAVPGRPDLMLINPEGYFWSEARVSDLVVTTHDGEILSSNGHTVETTAFCIHAPIHRVLPHAVAVLHTHMHHATAICMRKGGVVAPSYLSAMSFYQRIAYDRGFDGPALTPAEGERLAKLLGDDFILMMENHGPLVVGASLGEALLRLLYLEDTCKMQLLAEAGGRELQPIPTQLMAAIPKDVPRFKAYSKGFMAAVIRVLSREEPDFLG
ncbi:MAG: class II aldolase/adducin family protein [Alphaproteobacteria bacterium]|nr:class II aldolase/adducin family protein [Alphaproteobacteria bacterium]